MLKFIVSNPNVFIRFARIPLISRFFMLSVISTNDIRTSDVFAEVLKGLRYGDVTGKETYSGRFFDLDKDSIKVLASGMSIHDIGCSSGITSLEFYQLCAQNNLLPRFTISDKYTSLFVSKGIVTSIFDKKGEIKQRYFLKILLDQHLSNIFFLSKVFFKLFSLILDTEVVFKDSIEISLIDPQVKKLNEAGKITVLDFDIFQGDERIYDFIRCMNVLNHSYFSEEKIKIGLRTLHNSVKDNGYLLLGRTTKDSINKATLYKKAGNSFICQKKYNGGSEIDRLLVNVCSEID